MPLEGLETITPAQGRGMSLLLAGEQDGYNGGERVGQAKLLASRHQMSLARALLTLSLLREEPWHHGC